jgi:hypothetical protein
MWQIIHINKMIIAVANDVHIPSHKMHLQMQDCLVGIVIREDWLYHVAVCNPNKTTTITHMPKFVHGKVSTECFSEMGVEELFISLGAVTAKCYWVKYNVVLLCEKVEPISRHKFKKCLIVIWLAYNIVKAFCQMIQCLKLLVSWGQSNASKGCWGQTFAGHQM